MYKVYVYAKSKKQWQATDGGSKLIDRDKLFKKQNTYLYLPIGERKNHIDLEDGDFLIRKAESENELSAFTAILNMKRVGTDKISLWYSTGSGTPPRLVYSYSGHFGSPTAWGSKPLPKALDAVKDTMKAGDLFLVLSESKDDAQVVPSGDDSGLLINKTTGKVDKVQLEQVHGQLKLDDTRIAVADFEEDMFRITVTFIAANGKRIKKQVKEAQKAVDNDDLDGFIAASEDMARLAMGVPPGTLLNLGRLQPSRPHEMKGFERREVAKRAPKSVLPKNESTREKFEAGFEHDLIGGWVTGAAPGIVQGHNVLVSCATQLSKLDAVVAYCNAQSAGRTDKVASTLDPSVIKSQAEWDATFTGGEIGAGGLSAFDNAWQSVASVVSTIATVVKLGDIALSWRETNKTSQDASHRHLAHKELRAQFRYAAPDLLTNLAKSFTTITNTVDVIDKLAKGPLVAGGAAPGAVAAAPFISVVCGLVSVGLSTRTATRAQVRVAKFKRLQKNLKKDGVTLQADTQALLDYALDKMVRKQGFNYAQAGVGTFSVALGVVAIAAATNAWNPVGWALGGVSLLAGGGLLTYKIIRKTGLKIGHLRIADSSKKRARDKADAAGLDEPLNSKHFANLLVNHYLFLLRTHKCSVATNEGSKKSMDLQVIDGVLMGFGIDGWKMIYSPDYTQTAIERISRKL